MATFLAKTCYYTPHSTWVHAFIQGCNNEFAIHFKRDVWLDLLHGRRPSHTGRQKRDRWGRSFIGIPGVCCWYPRAPANYFNIAINFGSPGRFVREYMYKVLPYRFITDPCPGKSCTSEGQLNGGPGNCCPGIYVANVLYGTVSNRVGDTSEVPNVINLQWDSVTGVWLGSGFGTTHYYLFCSGGTWSFEGWNNAHGPTATSCNPFQLVFDNVDSQNNGTFSVLVTQ